MITLTDIDQAPIQEISNVYYDWHHNMAKGFNGTPLPADVPRCKVPVSYKLEGKHMAFYQLQSYIERRGIEI